jgi:hypothetical protein
MLCLRLLFVDHLGLFLVIRFIQVSFAILFSSLLVLAPSHVHPTVLKAPLSISLSTAFVRVLGTQPCVFYRLVGVFELLYRRLGSVLPFLFVRVVLGIAQPDRSAIDQVKRQTLLFRVVGQGL